MLKPDGVIYRPLLFVSSIVFRMDMVSPPPYGSMIPYSQENLAFSSAPILCVWNFYVPSSNRRWHRPFGGLEVIELHGFRLHLKAAQERRQDYPVHLWADHRGFPERDIQRMVGGVQDDPIL